MRTQSACAMVLALAIAGVTACGNDDPAGVEPVDLNGDWALVVNAICPGTISINHQGNNFSVSGTVGGGACPFSTTGEGSGVVEGSAISFGIGFATGSDQSGTGLGPVAFEGTIAAGNNRMTGTYSNESGLSGQWEAVRQ
jgi:hypothetical protein